MAQSLSDRPSKGAWQLEGMRLENFSHNRFSGTLN